MNPTGDGFRSLAVRSAVVAVVFSLLVGFLGIGLHFVLDERILEFSTNIVVTIVLLWAAFVIVYIAGYTLSVLEDVGSVPPHHQELAYRSIQLLAFSGVSVDGFSILSDACSSPSLHRLRMRR